MPKTIKATDMTTLARIQYLAEARQKADREMKDANSEKLKASKEALAELEESIKASIGCDDAVEAQRHLRIIQEQLTTRRETINDTQETYQTAKKAFDAADQEFFQAIADSKQGELFNKDGGEG